MPDPGALGTGGFVHAALFYRTPGEFTAGVLPYVEAGAAAREPVMVVSQGRNLQLLRAQLNGLGERVAFADLTG
ncbi:MAG TPA: MEDS domain-containing protein, partial [Streptosporangiaceae bacterium]